MTKNLWNGQSAEDVAHFLKHGDRLFPDDWFAAAQHHERQALNQMQRRPVTVSLGCHESLVGLLASYHQFRVCFVLLPLVFFRFILPQKSDICSSNHVSFLAVDCSVVRWVCDPTTAGSCLLIRLLKDYLESLCVHI